MHGRSGTRWLVQCSCFILSCAGLVLYFFTKCGLLAGLLAVDEFLEIQLEAVLLLARAANEVTAGKFDLSDAFHHSATLGGCLGSGPTERTALATINARARGGAERGQSAQCGGG